MVLLVAHMSSVGGFTVLSASRIASSPIPLVTPSTSLPPGRTRSRSLCSASSHGMSRLSALNARGMPSSASTTS
jgi:hypothetical protein